MQKEKNIKLLSKSKNIKTLLVKLKEKEIEVFNLKIQIKKMEESTNIYKEKALVDKLTSVYNREGLVQKVIENGIKDYIVVNIDIDNFKQVNDLLGHEMGDEVLRQLAKIFKTNVKESDIVARYGGDEFIILFNTENKDFVNDRIESIQNKINCYINKFNTENNSLISTDKPVSFSYGIIEYNSFNDMIEVSKNNNELYELKTQIIKADKDLYKQKRMKKSLQNNKQIYEEGNN